MESEDEWEDPEWPELKKTLSVNSVIVTVPVVEVAPVPVVVAPLREIINLMSDSSESAATIYTRTVIDDGSNNDIQSLLLNYAIQQENKIRYLSGSVVYFDGNTGNHFI